MAEYHELGIDEFILSGYPHLEEAYRVGEGVLPILRRRGLLAAPNVLNTNQWRSDPCPPIREPTRCASPNRVPNVSGGLVVSKIEQRMDGNREKLTEQQEVCPARGEQRAPSTR